MMTRHPRTAIPTSIVMRTASALAFGLLLHAGIAAAQSSIGAPGCQGDISTPRSIWRPAAATHVIQEFSESVLLAVPAGISTVTVELWGAGGGGGGGSAETYSVGGAGGGGGASGAYTRATIAVQPGKTYALVVGVGGHGGNGGSHAAGGEDGGASSVCDGQTVLVNAPGGGGGKAAQNNNTRGLGGQGRMAESSDSAPSALRRRGNDGSVGQDPLFEAAGTGGPGAHRVPGSVEPAGSFGGDGGAGESRPDPAGGGRPGGAGGVIVSW